LQDTPKFTQIGIFGFENTPSGSPAHTASAARVEHVTMICNFPELERPKK
jgi:hypothetical protein